MRGARNGLAVFGDESNGIAHQHYVAAFGALVKAKKFPSRDQRPEPYWFIARRSAAGIFPRSLQVRKRLLNLIAQ